VSTQSTVRKANAEQERAIFHKGGKLLSAGAGSGKTFVLIEHLVFLLKEVQKNNPKTEWNKLISSELSKIVLMTFTKKAAGEMSVRMMRKVEELVEGESEDNDKEFWLLVRQNLSFLNITTIHGFCHKLLGLGFWTEFPQQINLVSKIEHKDKIQKLFDKWFNLKSAELDAVFLSNSTALLTAMKEIFSSPELRVMWSDPHIPMNAEEEINRFLKEFIIVKGYGEFFDESIDLAAEAKDTKKKWYELLIQFNEVKISNGILSAKNYQNYHEFFKIISRFPSVAKEMSEAQLETFASIKELREDLKSIADDLNALKNNFKTYKKWVETIADLFQFIDRHYFEIDGFAFADLEYYVLKALAKDEVLTKVRESFSYFIVDEFQDTSFIQFEILKKLIGENSTKLFCVGDKKQAIYGFRGGELQVFADCAKMLGEENNYFLKNNFRSFSSIIEYNNELFEHVFPLGLKYTGHDPHSVLMEAQVVPESNSNVGEVFKIRTNVIGDPKEFDLDRIEAELLCEHIKEIISDKKYESICVLYRKLKPSSYLLEQFLKYDIPFGAQVKIDFSEDPVINLFLYLVELELHKNDFKKTKATLVLMESLLCILNAPFSLTSIKQFHFDHGLYGLRIAFHKFLFSIGLSNSFHMQNASVVDSICRLTREDVVKVYHLLKNEEAEEYACEMMSGVVTENKKRIIIMSAHASKGLEFDAVLLGGVHTNGRYNGMKDHIGKFPHSFKWKNEIAQKRFAKSPFYHLEAEILKLKDFSESKRLLYVACTRAVKQLVFADLFFEAEGVIEDLYEYDNSWIQALRLIHTNEIFRSHENVVKTEAEIPLIQKDSLGLFSQSIAGKLGIIAELSVTRLATIAECPHKFYLQNICKIAPDEKEMSLFVDDEEPVFYSSKKRGTEIHSILSKLFLNQMTVDKIPAKEKESILWAFELGKDLKINAEVISEVPVKFSLFGQMISGTPDLVFVASEKIDVWDFKTGLRDENSEDAYWFQLMCYAYAYAQIKSLSAESSLEISLLYVDQKELVTKSFSVNSLAQILFSYWSKTESLNQVNGLHCKKCEYSNLCRKGETSPSI
jgi:ATP-dependent helicase/nuclease subunit A